jgi:hypothetical protein
VIRIKKGDIVYYGGGLGRIIYIPPSRSYVTIRPLGSKFAMSWSWKFVRPFTEEDLKYTPPHQLKHLRRKCRKDSELVKRRCCRNCMHFKPKDSTCQEGGFSEIGDQDRKLTPEDCRAFTMR